MYMDESMHGYMYMDRWVTVYGWIDGCMDGYIYIGLYIQTEIGRSICYSLSPLHTLHVTTCN